MFCLAKKNVYILFFISSALQAMNQDIRVILTKNATQVEISHAAVRESTMLSALVGADEPTQSIKIPVDFIEEKDLKCFASYLTLAAQLKQEPNNSDEDVRLRFKNQEKYLSGYALVRFLGYANQINAPRVFTEFVHMVARDIIENEQIMKAINDLPDELHGRIAHEILLQHPAFAATGRTVQLHELDEPMDIGGDNFQLLFDSTGTKLALADKRCVVIFNPQIGVRVCRFKHAVDDSIKTVAFNHDGTLIATTSKCLRGYNNNYLRSALWNAETGEFLYALRALKECSFMAFNHSGTQLLAGAHNEVVVQEVSTGDVIGTLKHPSNVCQAVFNNDDNLVLTISDKEGGNKWNARIWHAQTEEVIHVLSHEYCIESALFNEASSQVITAGGDCVKIWDAQTGKENHTLQQPKSVTRLLSNADQIIAECCGEVTIWDSNSGRLVKSIPNEDYGRVLCVDALCIVDRDGIKDTQTSVEMLKFPRSNQCSRFAGVHNGSALMATFGNKEKLMIWAMHSVADINKNMGLVLTPQDLLPEVCKMNKLMRDSRSRSGFVYRSSDVEDLLLKGQHEIQKELIKLVYKRAGERRAQQQ